MLKKILPVLSFFLFLTGFTACDMTYIEDPDKPPEIEDPFLTIYGLPPNTQNHHISDISVSNASSVVAGCKDANSIVILDTDSYSMAKIPLTHVKGGTFQDTGEFLISLTVSVDAKNYIVIAPEDNILLLFLNGSASFDLNSLPEEEIPRLTVYGFPLNTKIEHFSSVSIYGAAGSVANCARNDIILEYEESTDTFTAVMPLTSGDELFKHTGNFFISFTANIDAVTRIIISRSDNILLYFRSGSSSYDLGSLIGYYDVSLANPDDYNPPVIKGGSSFYIDGIHSVNQDTNPPMMIPLRSGLLYVYAYRLNGEVFFEYSDIPPVYNPVKKGYYLDTATHSKRALFKMFFLIDGASHRYFVKTGIADPWPHLKYQDISDNNPVISDFYVYYSLSGSNNPVSTNITLPPGLYLIQISGGGGGGGSGYLHNYTVAGHSTGGNAGRVYEILCIQKNTDFLIYTGGGGATAPAPVADGHSDGPVYGNYASGTYTVYSSTYDYTVSEYIYLGRTSPGGGGGGGSGSFIFSEEGYFLCAGGGGGGSGASFVAPGGGGGAGGAIGSGGGGGAGGFIHSEFYNSSYPAYYQAYSLGGSGGGANPGAGGNYFSGNLNGASGHSFIFTNYYGYNGGKEYMKYGLYLFSPYSLSFTDSGTGGSTPYIPSIYVPFQPVQLFTQNANGSGANPPPLLSPNNYIVQKSYTTFNNNTIDHDLSISIPNSNPSAGNNGGHGGNNRNGLRGNGAAGGYGDGYNITHGSPGYIVIYRFNFELL